MGGREQDVAWQSAPKQGQSGVRYGDRLEVVREDEGKMRVKSRDQEM